MEIKKKIGVDIDDVIAGFMKSYLEFYNKKYNTQINLQDIKNYHLWKTGIHKSKEDSHKEISEFQNSFDFEKIDLIDGAKEGLNNLSEFYQIYFITSRPEELKDKTIAFFNKYFPNKEFNILYSGDVYGDNLSKSEICKTFEISVIIEDNPDYALDCASNGVKVFLLNKPWNENCEMHENIIRVNNWLEVGEKLLK